MSAGLRICLDRRDPSQQVWVVDGRVVLRMSAAIAREACETALALVPEQEKHARAGHVVVAQPADVQRLGRSQ